MATAALEDGDGRTGIHPYLLRELAVTRPNHMSAIDFTCIRLTAGWCYLVALLGLFSRYVVNWGLDDTLELPFTRPILEKEITIVVVNTDVFQAVKNGDLVRVTALVHESQDNIRPVDEYAYMPLHYAASYGHVGIIALLLDKGATMMDRVEHSQDAAIHLAAYCGKDDVIEYLLNREDGFNERKEQINVRNRQQETPLHKAVLSGCLSAASVLIDKGADIEAQRYDGSTALHLAVQRADIGITKLLLEKRASPNARDRCDAQGATPSFWAWYTLQNDIIQHILTPEQRSRYEQVFELLKQCGGEID